MLNSFKNSKYRCSMLLRHERKKKKNKKGQMPSHKKKPVCVCVYAVLSTCKRESFGKRCIPLTSSHELANKFIQFNLQLTIICVYLFKLPYLPKGSTNLLQNDHSTVWMLSKKRHQINNKKKVKCCGNNRNISFSYTWKSALIRQCTQIMWFNSWQHLYLKMYLNVNRFSFASRAPLKLFFFIVFSSLSWYCHSSVFHNCSLFYICVVVRYDSFFFFFSTFCLFFYLWTLYKSMLMPDSVPRKQPSTSDLWMWTLPSAYNNEQLIFIVWVMKLHISNHWAKRSANAPISSIYFRTTLSMIENEQSNHKIHVHCDWNWNW